jgi:Zn-dependent M28 family amino/carboxypeptidase
VLAGDIGERNLLHARALSAASDYIQAAFRDSGYVCTRHLFAADGQQCANLVATPGHATSTSGIVVVGAHYDTVIGSPGADDNASGIASLLALARLFSGVVPDCELRFVAFANEEPPYFKTHEMGSLAYARHCRRRGEQIVAMICLESIGYYTGKPQSQRYPFPLSLFYPSTADFVGFVGNRRSAWLVKRVIASFRRNAMFPSEGAILPEFVPGIGWSDHWAFWSQGYPAIMVTDTAFYRYPHYHCESDTPEQLDYDSLARVVHGLTRVIKELIAQRQTVRF